MAASSAIAVAFPMTASMSRSTLRPCAFFNPVKLSPKAAATSSSVAKSKDTNEMQASSAVNEKAVAGLTAVALTAAMLIPEVAEAAQPGLSPSLKNFLLSIAAGGVVLTILIGAVLGVANFDPVKRS